MTLSPGSFGPDGRCVTCSKRVQTTGGCLECLRMSYSSTVSVAGGVPGPAQTITFAPTVPAPDDAPRCPHSRLDWRHCPHCLGINSNGGTP